MPAHYQELKDQLKADLLDVLGNTATVCFGRPRRPIEDASSAIVRTRITRPKGGARQVHEAYEFDIAVRLAVPVPYPEDGGEVYAMDQAESLTDRLAPHTHTPPVPSDPLPYAGVGMMPEVTEVEYMDSEDGDGWIGFRLKFRVICLVFQ